MTEFRTQHKVIEKLIIQTQISRDGTVFILDGLISFEPCYGVTITNGAISTILKVCWNPRSDDIKLSNDLVRTTTHIVIIRVVVVVLDEVQSNVSCEFGREIEVQVGAHAETLTAG